MWFVAFLVGMALMAVSYLIMPKPKVSQPEATKDMDNPTAEAGKPIPVVFGTIKVKGLNFLWYGEKSINTYQVNS